GLLGEIARFGVASVKRIYGDFTSTRLQQWKAVLLEHSIQPVQQFAYTSGKNATDSSLIIDAMDLMYTRRFDGFIHTEVLRPVSHPAAVAPAAPVAPAKGASKQAKSKAKQPAPAAVATPP